MDVWKQGGDFKERLQSDKDIRASMTAAEIADCFDLSHTLEKVDYIFKRVFQKGPKAATKTPRR
jgi:adenylosuccinate lyase